MKCWSRKSLRTSGSLERSEPAAETARTEPDHLALWSARYRHSAFLLLSCGSLGTIAMKTWPLMPFVAFDLAAASQNGTDGSGSEPQSLQAAKEPATYTRRVQEPDDLSQELDRDAVALSKIPTEPIPPRCSG
jgi:hypothetical protein